MLSKNEQELVKTIFEYYKTNRDSCEREYRLSKDKNIKNIYKDVDVAFFQKEMTRTSIVVLTANEFETKVLHQHVYNDYQQKILRSQITLFDTMEKHNRVYAFIFAIGSTRIFHIQSNVTGSYTIGGSADAVRYCVKCPFLFPRAFISFGICFGCEEEKNHLCDTVISNHIYPYFIGAKINGKYIKTVDDYVLSTNPDFENRIKLVWNNNKDSFEDFKLEYEHYITGEAVISSSKYRSMFKSQTLQTVIAGDMEGYGLYKECGTAYRDMDCVIVKSICDWGIVKQINYPDIYKEVMGTECDDTRLIKDQLQANAAYHSYLVLKLLIEEKVFMPSIYDMLKSIILESKYDRCWSGKTLVKMLREKEKKLDKYYLKKFVPIVLDRFLEEGLLEKAKDTDQYCILN